MSAIDPLEPGQLLAERYRIGRRIGTGGMASVHRARDEVLGREVAVKAIVRPSADPAELRRERSEIDLLAAVHHRALVTLFDAGRSVVGGRGVSYLVMELVDGPSLAERLTAGPLPEPDVTRMAQDLAEALAVVHAKGIVHRDIKPANVLLAPSPLAGRGFDTKLTDFGIAAIVGAERITATGTVLGTAAYLSPEQATGARVDPSSDIYSLGLVLLESLTGHREYPGSLLESLSARLARDPVVPGSLGYRWKSLLTAMTSRDPGSRPTAAEVLGRVSATGADAASTTASTVAAAAPAVATAALAADPSAASAERTIAHPVSPAAAGSAGGSHAAGLADTAALTAVTSSPAARRPMRGRRGWAIASGLAAAGAVLLAVPAMAHQQSAPVASVKPSVEVVVADAPVAEPAPVEPAPAEPAPATPAPAPALVGTQDAGGGGGNGGGQGNGNGNGPGSSNGSGPGSNSGNGNGNGR